MMARAKTKAPPEDLVETFDCEQGSDEWKALRLGLATASVFGQVMADGRNGEPSKTRTKLLYQLAGEILSGQPAETYENDAIRRGRVMEAEALENYSFTRGVQLERVGFVRRTVRNPLGEDLVVGASPDALVGEDGMVEVKTARPDLIVELVESGRFPSEHKHQVHGGLWVTGRRWCDLKVFYSGMPVSPTFRIERDPAYIATIAAAVETFAFDLKRLVARVKAKGNVR